MFFDMLQDKEKYFLYLNLRKNIAANANRARSYEQQNKHQN